MKLVEITEQVDVAAIKRELKKLRITNYNINLDGTVDVVGELSIPHDCTSIPVRINRIQGSVSCDSTSLHTLVNGPLYVEGDFLCHLTDIVSLQGAPIRVSGDFVCSDTDITSLQHSPQYVGEDYDCGRTHIKTLVGISQYIGGVLYLHSLPSLRAILPVLRIKGLKDVSHEAADIIMRHYKPDGTGDIIALQDDLIEAGFGNIARMK